MNLVTICIFDVNRSKQATSHFHDMCTTSGEDLGKAAMPMQMLYQLSYKYDATQLRAWHFVEPICSRESLDSKCCLLITIRNKQQ